MQVTKGTWHMCEQCVPGSLSSSLAREPGNEAKQDTKSENITHLSVCDCGYHINLQCFKDI